MNILIIEDEPRAVRQLQTLLDQSREEYKVLDIIDTVEDSVIWFENHTAPDLVFLDIQLADGLSFEIFEKVKVEAPIIFTTAFDQYAIQAFKVNSIDYLLKPIKEEDLNVAIAKFRKTTSSVGSNNAIDSKLLNQLLLGINDKKSRESILVKQGKGQVQLKVSELLYFYADDGVTFGVTSDKRHIIDETIDQLYQSLDSADFFRINRGQVVSKSAVLKIDPYFNHRVKLSMTHPRDQEFVVSRPKTKDFKEWMNS